MAPLYTKRGELLHGATIYEAMRAATWLHSIRSEASCYMAPLYTKRGELLHGATLYEARRAATWRHSILSEASCYMAPLYTNTRRAATWRHSIRSEASCYMAPLYTNTRRAATWRHSIRSEASCYMAPLYTNTRRKRESISKPSLSTGALRCETVPCDSMTSGFVSDLFTVHLDDKGQPMLVICLQFTLSRKAKQCILTRNKFYQNCLCSHFSLLYFFYKMFHHALTPTTRVLMISIIEMKKISSSVHESV